MYVEGSILFDYSSYGFRDVFVVFFLFNNRQYPDFSYPIPSFCSQELIHYLYCIHYDKYIIGIINNTFVFYIWRSVAVRATGINQGADTCCSCSEIIVRRRVIYDFLLRNGQTNIIVSYFISHPVRYFPPTVSSITHVWFTPYYIKYKLYTTLMYVIFSIHT